MSPFAGYVAQDIGGFGRLMDFEKWKAEMDLKKENLAIEKQQAEEQAKRNDILNQTATAQRERISRENKLVAETDSIRRKGYELTPGEDPKSRFNRRSWWASQGAVGGELAKADDAEILKGGIGLKGARAKQYYDNHYGKDRFGIDFSSGEKHHGLYNEKSGKNVVTIVPDDNEPGDMTGATEIEIPSDGKLNSDQQDQLYRAGIKAETVEGYNNATQRKEKHTIWKDSFGKPFGPLPHGFVPGGVNPKDTEEAKADREERREEARAREKDIDDADARIKVAKDALRDLALKGAEKDPYDNTKPKYDPAVIAEEKKKLEEELADAENRRSGLSGERKDRAKKATPKTNEQPQSLSGWGKYVDKPTRGTVR